MKESIAGFTRRLVLLEGSFTEGSKVRVQIGANFYDRVVRFRKGEELYIVVKNRKYWYSDFEIPVREQIRTLDSGYKLKYDYYGVFTAAEMYGAKEIQRKLKQILKQIKQEKTDIFRTDRYTELALVLLQKHKDFEELEQSMAATESSEVIKIKNEYYRLARETKTYAKQDLDTVGFKYLLEQCFKNL